MVRLTYAANERAHGVFRVCRTTAAERKSSQTENELSVRWAH